MLKVKKKKLYAIITLTLLIVAFYLFISKPALPTSQSSVDNKATMSNKIDYGPATKEQTTAATDRQNESDTTANQDKVNIDIPSLKQVDDMLYIRTLITPMSNGSCTLTMKQGESVVTQKADTLTGPSYSTCKGFDVPLGSTSKGEWEIAINVLTDSNKTGLITKKVIIK